MPMDAWFRDGLRDLTHDLTVGGQFRRTLFDRRMVRRLIDDHAHGRRNEEIRLWTLLSLEQWARTDLIRAPAGTQAL